RGEGIDDLDSSARDILHVSGRQRQAVHLRRGSHEAVDGGDWVGNLHAPPLFRDLDVHRKDAVAMFGDELLEPHLEDAGGRGISPTYALDASADLTDCDHAEVEVVSRESVEPLRNVAVAAGPL